MKTVAVIPTLNEARHIAQVVRGARQYVDVVVVTDDRSRDGTPAAAISAGARVTSNKSPRGYGSNLANGIRYARKHYHPDVLVLLDGDGQHDPAEIPLLLAPLYSDRADVALGCRTNGHGMPAYRRFGNHLLSMAANVGSARTFPDALTGFWAFKSHAIPETTERGMGMQLELLIKSRAAGHRLAGVPVRPIYHNELGENSSEPPLRHGWLILKAIVKWRLRCEVLKREVRRVRLSDLANPDLRGTSLSAFWVGGLAGVLVDVDHPIAYLANGNADRFLHGSAFVLAVALLCFAGAYYRGLTRKVVLR